MHSLGKHVEEMIHLKLLRHSEQKRPFLPLLSEGAGKKLGNKTASLLNYNTSRTNKHLRIHCNENCSKSQSGHFNFVHLEHFVLYLLRMLSAIINNSHQTPKEERLSKSYVL